MTEAHGLSIKRIMGYAAVVMATLACLLVLYKLGQVVLLFVLSIIVAAALRKGVLALENRHVPRGVAILLWYLVIIGILGLGIYFLGATLRDELQAISNEIPQQYDRVLRTYQQSKVPWQQSLAQRLPNTDAVIASFGEDGAAEVGFQIAGFTSGILNAAISLIAILTLTFYWLADQERFERLWLTLLPIQQRAIARHTWRGVEGQVGAYVRSEATQFVLTVSGLWAAFQLLGLPYPTLYALYAAVVQLIPWIGIPLTLLPIGFMLLTMPWWQVLVTAAIVVVFGVLMDQVVEPRLSGEAQVHPITTVLAVMILGEASGVLGMLIALPLAATLQTVIREVIRVSTAPKAVTVTTETSQIAELQARIERLRTFLPEDADYRRESEGMMVRLQELLNQSIQVVQDRETANERARTERTAQVRGPSIFQRRKAS